MRPWHTPELRVVPPFYTRLLPYCKNLNFAQSEITQQKTLTFPDSFVANSQVTQFWSMRHMQKSLGISGRCVIFLVSVLALLFSFLQEYDHCFWRYSNHLWQLLNHLIFLRLFFFLFFCLDEKLRALQSWPQWRWMEVGATQNQH